MKYLSLFSGIGGFEYGIQTSNKAKQLECIGYSEIDKYAENIYKKHYPNHPRLGDATTINTKELPNFDLLVGGFPCQAFSIAGKRKGFDDTRGTLFFEIARILKDKKPKYFLLENVKGLLSHDKGRTFQTILRTLSELGYNVEWQILNSKDYGVPQNRERIYIKGFSREREGGREVLLRPKICSTIPTTKLKPSYENVKRNVYKRKYEIESTKLQELLRESKRKSGLSNKEISERLNVKETEVAHWFRTDEYWSVPNPDVWFQLKDLLCIDSDYFDKQVTSFVKEEGKYDMNERVYDPYKISPTLTGSVPLIKRGNVLPSGGQAGNVFDEKGVACTLSANGGGMGGKTGLYLVKDNDSRSINKIGNVSPTNHHGRDVYDTDGLCGTVLARDYKDPKIIKETMGDKIKVDLPDRSKCLVNKDDISCTLTAMGKQSRVHISEETEDNLCLRRLTPKECERLQGFPDDWTKYGADGKQISDTQRYKCCGNAVTTTVVRAIFDYWELKE